MYKPQQNNLKSYYYKEFDTLCIRYFIRIIKRKVIKQINKKWLWCFKLFTVLSCAIWHCNMHIQVPFRIAHVTLRQHGCVHWCSGLLTAGEEFNDNHWISKLVVCNNGQSTIIGVNSSQRYTRFLWYLLKYFTTCPFQSICFNLNWIPTYQKNCTWKDGLIYMWLQNVYKSFFFCVWYYATQYLCAFNKALHIMTEK